MKAFRVRDVLCFLFSLMLPAAMFASPQPCAQPSGQSYEQSKQAADLLERIRVDAYRVQDRAATLESFDDERQQIGWQADAAILTQQKAQIDRMDHLLYRLRTMQAELPAGQRAEIRAITPAVIEASDTTQAAIRYVNEHPHALFTPRYEGYATDVYNEAGRVQAAIPSSASLILESSVCTAHPGISS